MSFTHDVSSGGMQGTQTSVCVCVCVCVCTQAKSAVNTVLWLPDGRRCMTGSNNGDLVLWDGRNFGLETSMQVRVH